MKYYHNPRCSKSRQGLDLLRSKGGNPEVILYLDEPITSKELKTIITKVGISPENLIRKNESIFKENFKGKVLTDDQWIQAMVDYPKLIERPILIVENKGIIGRPPEKILSLI